MLQIKYIISRLFLFVFLIGNASANNPEVISSIGDQLRSHLEYNEKNKDGNFLMYYSEDFVSSPISPPTSEWFKEDFVGLTPYKEEIIEKLNYYNNLQYKDAEINYIGKLQHYVMVVDVPVHIKITKETFVQDAIDTKYQYNNVYKTERTAFKNQVNTALTDVLDSWGGVFSDPNNASKYWITVVFIQKEIGADGFVKASLDVRYARAKDSSNKYYTVWEEYHPKAKNNVKSVAIQGLNVVYEDVLFFINTFWEAGISNTPCNNIDAVLTSDIATDFVNKYCEQITNENDPFGEKKKVILKTAKFLDLLFYHQQQTYSFGNYKEQCNIVDETDIRSKWWDEVEQEQMFFYFLKEYLENPNPPIFRDFLYEHYLNNLSTENLNVYEDQYLALYIDIDCPAASSQAIHTIWTTIRYYNLPTLGYLDIFGNYDVNNRLNKLFQCIGSDDFNLVNKQAVLAHILDSEVKEEFTNTLWDEVLNPAQIEVPGAGASSIEIATNLSKFIQSVTPIDQLPVYAAIDDNINTPTTEQKMILVNIDDSLLPKENEVCEEGGCITYRTDVEAHAEKNGQLLEFSISSCTSVEIFPIPIQFNNDCALNQNATSDISKFDFFELVYAVVLKEPGFWADCEDTEQNPCKNIVSLECAFVTATKIRQEKFNHTVSDVSAIVGTILLPLSVNLMYTKTGFQFLKHGIFVANDIAAILIAADQEGFVEKCKNQFGEVKGQEYASNAITFSCFLGGIQVIDAVGSAILPTKVTNGVEHITNFNKEKLIALIADKRHADEVFKHTGIPLVGPKYKSSIVSMEDQLKKHLTKSKIDELVLAKQKANNYHNITRPGVNIYTSEYDNVRKLIDKYRTKYTTAPAPEDRISEIINQMEVVEFNRLKLALNGNVGLDDILTALPTAAGNRIRVKAWSVIDGLNESLKPGYTSIIKLADDITVTPGLESWMKVNGGTNASYVNQTKFQLWDEVIAVSKTADDVPYRASIGFIENYAITKNAPRLGNSDLGSFEKHLLTGEPIYYNGSTTNIKELKGLHHTDGITESSYLTFSDPKLDVTTSGGITFDIVYGGPPPTSLPNSNGLIIAVESGTEILYPNNSLKAGRTFVWGKYDDGLGNIIDAWRIKKSGLSNLHLNDYFPSWSSQKTIEEIAFARSRLKVADNLPNTNLWKVNSSDGTTEIIMGIDNAYNGNLPTLGDLYGTAYPN